jgi:hypothetical protein
MGMQDLNVIKIMVIQNVSQLSARCPAMIKELKTRIWKRLPLFHRKNYRRQCQAISQQTNVLLVKQVIGEALFKKKK